MAEKVWRANDGTYHDTKEAAEACEAYGEHAEIIDRYVATIDTSSMSDRAAKAHLTRTRNTAVGLLRWIDAHGNDDAPGLKEVA